MKRTFILLFWLMVTVFTGCSQESVEKQAQDISREWVAKTVFPYFKDARFINENEYPKFGIKNESNLAVFKRIQKEPKSINIYKGERNNTPLFENELDYRGLYFFLQDECYRAQSYNDSIERYMKDQLLSVKEYTSLTDSDPRVIRFNEAVQLISNVHHLASYPKHYFSKVEDIKPEIFYFYYIYFVFDNPYVNPVHNPNLAATVILLDDKLNVLNSSDTGLKNYDFDGLGNKKTKNEDDSAPQMQISVRDLGTNFSD